MSNILIFGSTGLLGSNFILKNNFNHNIYGFENKRKIKFKNIQTTRFKFNNKIFGKKVKFLHNKNYSKIKNYVGGFGFPILIIFILPML